MPISTDDEDSWNTLLLDLQSNAKLIETFVPMLNTFVNGTKLYLQTGTLLFPWYYRKAIDMTASYCEDFRKETDETFIHSPFSISELRDIRMQIPEPSSKHASGIHFHPSHRPDIPSGHPTRYRN